MTPDFEDLPDVDADRLAEDVAYRRALVAFAQNQYIATHSGNPAHRTLIYAQILHPHDKTAA